MVFLFLSMTTHARSLPRIQCDSSMDVNIEKHAGLFQRQGEVLTPPRKKVK